MEKVSVEDFYFTDGWWVLIKLRCVLYNQVRFKFQNDLVCLFYVLNSILTSQLARYLYLLFSIFPNTIMAKLLVCRCFLNMKKKTVYTDLSLFPLPFRLFMFYCFLFVYIIFSKKEKKNFKKENKKEKNKSLQLKQYPIKETFFEK